MDWSKVYSYCERGGDPGFWAEPLNAISNGAFILAGLAAAWQLARSPRKDRALFEWLLIAVILAIGVGSFLFHTYATVWAIPFDTIPISLFMLAYLGYALRRFAGLPWILIIASLIAFYASVRYMQGIHCANELLPMTRAAGKRCFNGTLGYTVKPTNTKLQLGMQNITNRQPPILYQNNVLNSNTDVSTYDLLGRRFFVSFNQKF